MNDQKQQIVEKLKAATNILVTVNANPSIDQLASCIGLSLMLNKLDKHATAVFSGQVPPTIDFLKPEKTIEKNTDSLRDFIISLDKSKADKLRYKVEDDVVKIFITPYKTSITEKDLVFSQGDFNVDVVVGLGIHRQQDLDSAITAHGRILHDATVVCINNTPETELGSVNWLDLSASSLSELVASIADDLGSNVLDQQNATALLAGIVAETNHFGNEKTTPHTMTVSARLLEAGADQRLVADKLNDVLTAPTSQKSEPASRPNDGSIAITHTDVSDSAEPDSSSDLTLPAIIGSDQPRLPDQPFAVPGANVEAGALSMGTALNANVAPKDEASSDTANPLGASVPTPILSHDAPEKKPEGSSKLPSPQPNEAPKGPGAQAAKQTETAAPGVAAIPPQDKNEQNVRQTLSELEKLVGSPHVQVEEVDSARKAVENALKVTPEGAPLEPLAALNAQPVNLDLGHNVPLNDEPATNNASTVQDRFDATQPPAQNDMPTNLPDVPALTPPPFGPYNSPSMPVSPLNNEPAPLGMSPADQPFTMPLPPSLNVPPPESVSPTSTSLPPQGPPPPPLPPMPPNFSGS